MINRPASDQEAFEEHIMLPWDGQDQDHGKRSDNAYPGAVMEAYGFSGLL